MSMTAMPSAVASRVSTGAVRYRPYVLFALFASLYLLPFMRIMMVGTDEGTLDYGAVRVYQGQVFAKDFFEVIGPGTFYWLAGFYELFGVSFLATRICLLITSLGTMLAMYYLSGLVCRRYRLLPCVWLAGAMFGGLWPAISHHNDSNFFALLTVVCVARWQQRGGRILLTLAGALAGMTTAFLQPKGMLLLLAVVIWLWFQRHSGRGLWSTVLYVTGSYAAIVGAVLIYFGSKGALKDLIYDNFLWPAANYGQVNSLRYAHGILAYYWDHWVSGRQQFPWTVGMAVVLMVPVVCVAVLPAILVSLGVFFRSSFKAPCVLLLWLGGGAIWVSELHRVDMTHLVFGSLILMILCVSYIEQLRVQSAKYALQLLMICSTCLAAFNFLITMTARPVQTRVGKIRMFTPPTAVTFLQEHVRSGEEIFAYPYCPSYYFLTSTVNPTSYSILIHNYNTPSQFEEVAKDLDIRHVEYVVWDKNLEKITEMVFPSSSLVAPPHLVLENYIETHYSVVFQSGEVLVMRRNDARADDR